MLSVIRIRKLMIYFMPRFIQEYLLDNGKIKNFLPLVIGTNNCSIQEMLSIDIALTVSRL